MVDHVKAVGDGISLAASLGALAGLLPVIAAIASLIWTLIRIYETKTVQYWVRRCKQKLAKRRLNK